MEYTHSSHLTTKYTKYTEISAQAAHNGRSCFASLCKPWQLKLLHIHIKACGTYPTKRNSEDIWYLVVSQQKRKLEKTENIVKSNTSLTYCNQKSTELKQIVSNSKKVYITAYHRNFIFASIATRTSHNFSTNAPCMLFPPVFGFRLPLFGYGYISHNYMFNIDS